MSNSFKDKEKYILDKINDYQSYFSTYYKKSDNDNIQLLQSHLCNPIFSDQSHQCDVCRVPNDSNRVSRFYKSMIQKLVTENQYNPHDFLFQKEVENPTMVSKENIQSIIDNIDTVLGEIYNNFSSYKNEGSNWDSSINYSITGQAEPNDNNIANSAGVKVLLRLKYYLEELVFIIDDILPSLKKVALAMYKYCSEVEDATESFASHLYDLTQYENNDSGDFPYNNMLWVSSLTNFPFNTIIPYQNSNPPPTHNGR